MIDVQLKLLEHASEKFIPAYATQGAAALDLRAATTGGLLLLAGEQVKIGTGIAIHIASPSYCGLILPRSSLGSRGLVLANTIGLIDSDYQGELMVVMLNRSKEAIRIEPGDRIAQLMFMPVARANLIQVDDFIASVRGEGGFGSTGVK